ncbi:putative L-fucose:H+ symporter permease-like protein [Seiridium unicorne]|uniref:L-fucose:H+ symporter permease-like protein n=1 Tax=Seiridium unicorne TaxID=138068 RepID=A0ABR2VB52_9PEZI
MLWPTAHFSNPENKRASFGGFCACTLNVVIGNLATASARFQFCQSCNGVASFIGPLIAAKFFFEGEHANSLTSVQFVYVAVACAGAAVAVLFFFFAKLPEVPEEMLRGQTTADNPAVDRFGDEVGTGPLYKQYNMILAFIAQFCYVGAQVTIATFLINYATGNGEFTSDQGSNMLSYSLICFTVGRFVTTGIATVLQPDFIMMVYTVITIGFNTYICVERESTLGVALGILVMGVSGGAVLTPMQGVIADTAGTRISYIVPLVGFVYVLGYVTTHWFRHGRHIRRVKEVVATTSAELGALEDDSEKKRETVMVEKV